MAEVGLVTFARVALEVATAAVPLYRNKKSNHLFTQPQLVSVLCLMRYEDWTFREAKVRLAEHTEPRKALGLKRIPDHTTLFYSLRRLSEEMVSQLLEETIRRLPPPPPGGTTVAVDGRAWLQEPSAPSSSSERRIGPRAFPGAFGSSGW